MKLKLALASLLLAATSPFTVSAQLTEVVPGEVGVVTFALRVASETGGFTNGDYYLEEPLLKKNTYKSVIVLNRLDPIATLVTRFDLPGLATDYSIRYVKSNRMSGYFLVNKTETTIICIGSDNYSRYDDVISTINSIGDEIANETSITITKENGDYTERGATTSSLTGARVYLNFNSYPYYPKLSKGSSGFECTAFLSRAGTYTATYISNTDSYVETNRTGAIKFTDLIGSNSYYYDDFSKGGGGYSQFISGSISISALRPVANISSYVQAYQERYDSESIE
jgi:hypothetical protein